MVSVNAQSVFMTRNQCKRVVKGCKSRHYNKVVRADRNCNDCCRRSGCARGDCKRKHCECKRCKLNLIKIFFLQMYFFFSIVF